MDQRLNENEIMRLLEQYRPSRRADEEWNPSARAAALAAAFDDSHTARASYVPRKRHRRWPVVVGGIAAAAATALVIELVPHGSSPSPPGSAGAAAPTTATVSSP